MHDPERCLGLDGFSGRLPLFPLPSVVFFPCTLLPLHVFEPRYRAMVADATASEQGAIGVVLLRPGWESDYYGAPPVHDVTCLGKIVEQERTEDGRYKIVLCGLKRARILRIDAPAPYRVARVDVLEDTPISTLGSRAEEEAEALRGRLLDIAARVPGELLRHRKLACALRKLDAPLGCSTDLMADSLHLSPQVKQSLLEELNPIARAEVLIRAVEAETRALAGAPKRLYLPQPSIN
jgi:Lon protease-like protein